MEDRRLFPAVRRSAEENEIRDLLDVGIAALREIARILAVVHGCPDLGNKPDPVDELVYIILARKTREDAYQRTFDALKKRFATWDEMLSAPRESVTALIRSGGLSERKTVSLFGALGKLRETFGDCTLEPAREWPDHELETFLCSLPEISKKSAYCVMMYSLGRAAFPVDTHVGRVLARVGPYRELGLSLTGLDHKKLQAVLADLVPPVLRYSLHVNLVAHGRKVCLGRRPLCERCDIRNFCGTFRRAEGMRLKRTSAPTYVDLFAGAGGLSEGFRRAGFRGLLAVDSDAVSLRTYWLNHTELPDNRIVLRDIRELALGELRRLVGGRTVDVLIGAPPCQGFSHAGFRSKRARTGYRVTSDARNYLFQHMVAAALELKPRLILMENVPGMQSARHADVSFLERAATMLRRGGGYHTTIWRLNAAAFGVPQDRIRYFLIASRTGLSPAPPAEEYQDIHRPGFDADALPPVTLEEAIFDLPARQAGTGTGVDPFDRDSGVDTIRLRRFLRKHALLSDSPMIYNHHVRYHNERDLELYALLRPGEDSVHAVERHGRHDLMRYRNDVFDDKYYRLRPDRPCKTIVAHLAKDGNGYIHPQQIRSISIREAARVQSFPDSYVFCGSPSDQWVQVGNAVPPIVAEAIARSFQQVLETKTPHLHTNRRGRR
jgi:DNA (cytosine-5)-methyltransferase 1